MGRLSTVVALGQLSICQLELTLNLPHPSGIILTSLLKWSSPKNTQALVSLHGMDAAAVAINYLRLSDNGRAGDRKEYLHRQVEGEGGAGELCGVRCAGKALLWSIESV